MADEELAHVSSTLIKQIAPLSSDERLARFVPLVIIPYGPSFLDKPNRRTRFRRNSVEAHRYNAFRRFLQNSRCIYAANVV